MEKQQMLDQAKDRLTPFETGNIVDFVQNLSLESTMNHPFLIVIFLIFAFYAVVKRSKFVLLFLFSAISIMLLIKYTLAPEVVGGGMTISSMFPFIVGGLVIGVALIYLTFIKHE